VKRIEKEAHDRLLANQMVGLLTTRAALRGIDAGGLPAFANAAGKDMAECIASSYSRFERKLALATGRYSLGIFD
jgi:hypothetical protein